MAKKGKRVRKADAPVQWYIKQNRRWLRRIGVLAALAIAAALLFFLVDPFAEPKTAIDASGNEIEVGVIDRAGASPRAGSPAPEFVLADYEQQAVYLDDFRGKVVVMNFWASWCEFCEEEMPDIFRLAERYPDDLVVLAVNRGQSQGTAQSWSDGHDFGDLPNVYWLLDEDEDVTDAYRVDGMPQTFVLDDAGNVASEIRRVTDLEDLLANVQGLGLDET